MTGPIPLKFLKRLKQSTFARIVAAIWAWQPLTGRGLLVAILATVAVRMFALPEYDLVADVLGTSALALLALILLSAIFYRLRLASRISADARFDTTHPLSRKKLPSGIILKDSSIPPFFSLRVEREFRHPGVDSPVHVVRGKVPEEGQRYLIDEVIFPHRGFWEMDGLKFKLEDTLGLSRLTWRLPFLTGLEVGAETIEISPLPIVASSARAGDELSQSRERAGDLFDIKQYDPSDGIKRILWKTYAKSGQLVVRRPEPAVIPEGELALFLVAGPDDDYVAGALQDYLRQLDQAQITVLFSTDGMSESGVDAAHGFLTAEEEIKRAINRCVWSNDCGTGSGFAAFLGALERSQRFIHNAVVFGPEDGEWLEKVTEYASRSGVKLHVAVVPKVVDPAESLRDFAEKRRFEKLPKVVQRIKWLRPGRRKGGVVGAKVKDVYATGAELHVVQGRNIVG